MRLAGEVSFELSPNVEREPIRAAADFALPGPPLSLSNSASGLKIRAPILRGPKNGPPTCAYRGCHIALATKAAPKTKPEGELESGRPSKVLKPVVVVKSCAGGLFSEGWVQLGFRHVEQRLSSCFFCVPPKPPHPHTQGARVCTNGGLPALLGIQTSGSAHPGRLRVRRRTFYQRGRVDNGVKFTSVC